MSTAAESKKHGRGDEKAALEGEPAKKKQKKAPLSAETRAHIELIGCAFAKNVPEFIPRVDKIRAILQKATEDVVDVITEADAFDENEIKRAVDMTCEAKDTFVRSMLLPYAPASKKSKDIDFKGTMFAMVGLGADCSRDMHAAAVRYVKEEDLCTDLAVTKGKPFEAESHVTVILGLPPGGMNALLLGDYLKRAGLTPFKVRIGGLGHFHNSSVWESDGKLHERDVLYARVEDHQFCLKAIRELLGPCVLEGKSDKERGFTPHVTLAFLRYGAGALYEKNEDLLAAVKASEYTVRQLEFRVVGDRSVAPVVIDLST